MTEKWKINLITAILLLLVSISGYFFYSVIFNKSKTSTENNLKPDVIIENITSVNFDAQGNPEMHIFSPEMEYSSTSKQAILSKPVIILYQTNNPPWIITSNTSHTFNNFTLLKLIGNVKMHQAASSQTADTHIHTSELTIYPKTHIAKTQALLTFTQTNSDHSKVTVTAKGVIANQKTGQVKLLSNVNGNYTSPK